MFGGPSIEHEISVISALQVISAIDPKHYEVIPLYIALSGKWYTGHKLLDRQFYKKNSFSELDEVTILPDPSIGGIVSRKTNKLTPIDVCLLVFHGQGGEDGCIQGLLELADIPYTGGSVLSSSLSMNKYACKKFLEAHDINCLSSHLVNKDDASSDFEKTKQDILQNLKFPLFIKPNHLGSSVGISKANNEKELDASLAKVFQYDDKAIIEPCLTNIIEFNVAVLDKSPLTASFVEIPVVSDDFLSYEDKYQKEGNKITGGSSAGMASLIRVVDPTDVDPKLKEKIKSEAIRAFKILDCGGVCRFDFLFDLNNNQLYFNEVNPIPGSFAFYLWDTTQLLFTDIIDQLIKGALNRKVKKHSLIRDFGFRTL